MSEPTNEFNLDDVYVKKGYRFVCPCGAVGIWRNHKWSADADRHEHIRAHRGPAAIPPVTQPENPLA